MLLTLRLLVQVGDLVKRLRPGRRSLQLDLKFGLILEIRTPFYKILWNGGIITRYNHYSKLEVISESR